MKNWSLKIFFILIADAAARAQGAPTPEVTGTALNTVRKEFDGATLVEFKPEANLSLPSFPIEASPNGDHFYLHDPQGVLRKISLPEFKEVCRLTMIRSMMGLALSQEGLVVLSGSKERIDVDPQFWILDPETLAVRKRMPTEYSEWLVASPASSTVLSVSSSGKKPDRPLLLTDLKSSKAPKEVSGSKLLRDVLAGPRKSKLQSPPSAVWAGFRLTPDLKHLFNGPFQRLVFKGSDTAYEETGPPSTAGMHYTFSTDSKLLGLTTVTGSKPDLTACIFKVENLQKPVVTVPDAEFLAFGKGNRLFVRLSSGELQLLDATGKKEKQVNLMIGQPGAAAQVGQGFVNPAGNRLLLRTGEKVLCIDLAD